MEHIPPRLHREFFDRIKEAEAIFSEAGFSPEEFRPILDQAISRYCYETRQTFSSYLRSELENRPGVCGRVPAGALKRLLAD